MIRVLPHGFTRWSSLAEFKAAAAPLGEAWRGHQAFERQLAAGRTEWLSGYCATCEADSDFRVECDSRGELNWRETLVCRACGLSNRLRASLHLARLLHVDAPPGVVYVTEQLTPTYQWLQPRVPTLVGSEYVDSKLPSGTVVAFREHQVRHEDLARTSFDDAACGIVLSFDVLEHVPRYRTALAELARILRPGGLLLVTVPFAVDEQDTIVRARVEEDGQITFLLPPIYHGDPTNDQGVLCYYEFGWHLIDELREVGFSKIEVVTCWAPGFGYLGSSQPFLVAWR